MKNINSLENILTHKEVEINSRIGQALRALEGDSSKLLTLKQASAFCGLGESRFRRLFLKETGLSYKKYVNEKRYIQALKYLESSDLSIKQISYKIGYKSCSTFCMEFKRKYGITPSGYRNNAKLKKSPEIIT